MRYSSRLKKVLLFSLLGIGLGLAGLIGILSVAPNKAYSLAGLYDCDWCAASTGDVDCNKCEEEIYDGMELLWDYFEWFFRIDEEESSIGKRAGGLYQKWLIIIWDIILQELPLMTQQLTAASFLPTTFVGHFFDARHQLKTQSVIDQYHVDTIRDYQPSTALCKFGTSMRGLASSQQISAHNQILFSDQSLGRQLARIGRTSTSQSSDNLSRIQQFANTYCDPDSYGGYLSANPDEKRTLCGKGAQDPARYDKDISFFNTFFHPKTLDLNLMDTSLQEDEEDIITLARNLYTNKVYNAFGDVDLKQRTDDLSKEIDTLSNRRTYHRLRALVASKNVAENSFYALASQKAKGSGASSDYLVQILETLGYPTDEAEDLIGEAPSYDAQMEILTKKIYQRPGFVTELIDKPANINRQKATLMSFELMQERDGYQSLRRQEMMLALMLEKLLKKRYDQVRSNFP